MLARVASQPAAGAGGEIVLTADNAGVAFTPTVYTSTGAGTTISSTSTTANVDNTVKVSLSREGIFIEELDGSGLTTTGTATANDGTDLTDSSKVLSDFSWMTL